MNIQGQYRKMIDNQLPGFIIIGAMKGGTSSLAYYLNLHPELSMSKIKETNYFRDGNYEKGVEWYKSMFHQNELIKGEASPNYTKLPEIEHIPERIYELLPDVKLIYVVKDPYKRIVSHLKHNYLDGREKQEINEIFTNMQNKYIWTSKYYFQLSQYLKYFNRINIKVITSEDLENKRVEVLSEIFKFLDVDNSFYSEHFLEKKHQTLRKPKKNSLVNFLVKSSVVRWLLKTNIFNFKSILYKVLERKAIEITIDNQLKERIIHELEADVEQLKKYMNNPLIEWKDFNKI